MISLTSHEPYKELIPFPAVNGITVLGAHEPYKELKHDEVVLVVSLGLVLEVVSHEPYKELKPDSVVYVGLEIFELISRMNPIRN